MSDRKKGALESPPPGWRLDPRYVECKTRRTQLLLAPSLHARIKTVAETAGISFNSWCSQALEVAVREAERELEIEDALAGDGGDAPDGEASPGPSM
ncbi:MAG: toxin-antitoxin system HicB family antitoxin [Desulfovibrio sp.]|nr:toxin-antitoxin system HicB family antitoxin [Desulfovibrio sp.]